ncbi:hypothetical protein A3L09_08560 [Thermococcus profundus]|uniref:Uncharacterized protein n=1 Tax=Thermococcus profundus TaxID=49899 RepID=A0A2Z2MCP0_THEPR|nr:hypothetical protein [Thermococcus profundus]ASJ03303.1 hypothetical protein A3L09_08560 [Thermococcus profundus]
MEGLDFVGFGEAFSPFFYLEGFNEPAVREDNHAVLRCFQVVMKSFADSLNELSECLPPFNGGFIIYRVAQNITK